MTGTTRRNNRDLGWAIALSLALHAFVIALQFGEAGMGLPLFGTFGNDRSASVPVLQAILLGQGQPRVAEDKVQPPRTAELAVPKIEIHTKEAVVNPPNSPVLPAPAEPSIATASIRETKTPPAPPEVREKAAAAVEKQPQNLPSPAGVAVLDTDRESTWRIGVEKAARESEEKARDDQAALEQAKEAEALARRNLEQAENLKKAELAALAKAQEEALELKRAEEQMRVEEEKRKATQAAVARAAEEALEAKRLEEQMRIEDERTKAAQAAQAALARANEQALERRRLDEEKRKADQAAAAKATEEALNKRLQEEALARSKQQAQAALQAERAAEGQILANERGAGNAANAAPGKAEGRQDGAAGPAAEQGSGLAGRALDQARSGQRGSPFSPPAIMESQRRGSILGRDPRDIRLAFYGEGWRQKVERIGSLNYPKLSRNLHYEPLVVTVSINSDGTLAGVRIVKSSGHLELDEAVRRIVEMSAPFAAFPPDLRRNYDVVDITRTWSFVEERTRIYSQ